MSCASSSAPGVAMIAMGALGVSPKMEKSGVICILLTLYLEYIKQFHS